MFNQNLTLADASAANKTFNLVYQDGQESRRLDVSTDLTQPRLMTIRHQTVGKGSDIGDRHNVLFSKRIIDATGNILNTSVSVVVTVPRDTDVSQTVVDDLVAFAKNFFSTANTTQLLRGES